MRSIAEADASYLGACALRLQSTARQRYLPFIEKEFPHLAARYRSTYAHSHQVGERYRQGLRSHFQALCAAHGVTFDRYYKKEEDVDDATEPRLVETSESAQLRLAL